MITDLDQLDDRPRSTLSVSSSVLGGIDPIVMRTRPFSGPSRIMAGRVGADSRGATDSFCGRLRVAGAPCVVMRN